MIPHRFRHDPGNMNRRTCTFVRRTSSSTGIRWVAGDATSRGTVNQPEGYHMLKCAGSGSRQHCEKLETLASKKLKSAK